MYIVDKIYYAFDPAKLAVEEDLNNEKVSHNYCTPSTVQDIHLEVCI